MEIMFKKDSFSSAHFSHTVWIVTASDCKLLRLGELIFVVQTYLEVQDRLLELYEDAVDIFEQRPILAHRKPRVEQFLKVFL